MSADQTPAITQEIVVGGVPAPIGGVTTFVRRYACKASNQVGRIVDFYPGEKEALPAGCKAVLTCVSGVRGLFFWFVFSRVKCPEPTVFFNFSRARACMLLLAFPKRRGEHWSLMLHHGRLALPSGVSRLTARVALSRVDQVRYVSDEQRHFYKALGLPAGKLLADTSYCEPVDHLDAEDALEEVRRLREGHKILAVTSGFPTDLYNLKLAIDAFDALERPDAALAVFIYGPGPLRDDLHRLAAEKDWLFIFDGLGERYFSTFLKNADVYLRLTETDSMGIAVWDAAYWGVRIVASDVCKRPDVAQIVDLNGPKSDIETAIRKALSD